LIIEAMDTTVVAPPGWRCRAAPVDSSHWRRCHERDRSATFEVVKNALYAAAEEMKVVLAKTAYSPLLKVAGDYSCGLFDATGEMVAQGPDLPIHLGSMPLAVKAVVRAFPRAEPGDVFIHNDPYYRRKPSARRERGDAGFPRRRAARLRMRARALAGHRQRHARQLRRDHGDLRRGTATAARASVRGGRPQPDVDQIIFANVRTPEERRGDLARQIAANLRGTTRLAELADKHGRAKLLAIMQEVMDYSERMMRAALAALPDGTRAFEDFCDGDGILEDGEKEDAIFRIRMQVTKRGIGSS
jgi:N-methylhydantoinase B